MSEPDSATDQSTDEPTSDEREGSILEDGGVDTDERAGRSLGIDPQAEPDKDTKQDMEAERERRLDPDNRPDGAEVDNTQRDFDVDAGAFTDSDHYTEDEKPYAGSEEES